MSKIRDGVEHYRLRSQISDNYGEFRPEVEVLNGYEEIFYYDKDKDELGNIQIGQPFRLIRDKFTESGDRYERAFEYYDDDFNMVSSAIQYDNGGKQTNITYTLDGNGMPTEVNISTVDESTSWSDATPSQGWSIPDASTYLKVIDISSPESIAGEVTLQPGTYDIYAVGGGGGGSAGLSTDMHMDGSGGGGAAGVMSRIVFTDTVTLPLSIGAGGAGATTDNQNGGGGGTTTIGALVADGGYGGRYPRINAFGEPGEPGDESLCSGDIKWSGANATLPINFGSTSSGAVIASMGAPAGGPMSGVCGGSGNYDADGGLPSQYGAGGRGGNRSYNGQNGGDGVIFIIGVK